MGIVKVVTIVLAHLLLPLIAEPSEPLLRLPSGTLVSFDRKAKEPQEGWHQEGIMPLSYVMACQKMRECLRRQGWKRIMEIPMPARGLSLSVWKKRGHKVLVRLWKKEPSETGISWGEYHHEV